MASSGEKHAKEQQYRQSDKGRMARKMRAMQPEVKLHRKMIRDAKRKMAGHH